MWSPTHLLPTFWMERSEAPNSSEEDLPIKSDKESVEQRRTGEDNDADIQGTLVDVLYWMIVRKGKLKSDSTGINCEECQPDGNAKQNSAGSYALQEKSVAENGASETQASMFHGNRRDNSYIDCDVSCTNSEVQVKVEDHKLGTACLSVVFVNQLTTEPASGPISEIQSSLRDSEEEVDVMVAVPQKSGVMKVPGTSWAQILRASQSQEKQSHCLF
ncbi:ZZ-type zinc finger-containing protein 3 [Fukomys damarensis]|uniref:ZZ-type zinc finger-containing protein 3 n=1 Tax=Fukomys damarensis TaxID=885580 RepID=A0A091CL80_FUKDA|nr:ZZ-type zinc finger-containing protein 3 [Fukomys damarensis]